MRPDGPVTDLTEAQKKMAQIAGIPADRAGLGAEYPKMVFRPGVNPRHQLENKPLLMGNGPSKHADALTPGTDSEIAYVDSPEDEALAIANGWFLSLDPSAQKAELERRLIDVEKDMRIADLEAQVAVQGEKRGPGRPRNAETQAQR